MADPFDEVEENYRQERLAGFAKKYWPIAAVAVAAVLLGVVGDSLYRNWNAKRGEAAATALASARELVQAGEVAEAAKAFAAAADGAPQGYRALAQMEQAGALISAGDIAGAIAAFDEAAKSAADPVLRDAATLKAAMLAADQESLAAIEKRVGALAEGGGPYAHQARELIAMEAIAEGDAARARTEFEVLSLALDAPEGVRQRAQAAIAFLGRDAAAKPAQQQGDAPAAAPSAAPAAEDGAAR